MNPASLRTGIMTDTKGSEGISNAAWAVGPAGPGPFMLTLSLRARGNSGDDGPELAARPPRNLLDGLDRDLDGLPKALLEPPATLADTRVTDTSCWHDADA